MSANCSTATYSFLEAVERIADCRDLSELNLLCSVLNDEKKQYALFYWKLIAHAVKEKQDELKG